MNCSDHYGEDWGDVTGEKQEVMEAEMSLAMYETAAATEWFEENSNRLAAKSDGYGTGDI